MKGNCRLLKLSSGAIQNRRPFAGYYLGCFLLFFTVFSLQSQKEVAFDYVVTYRNTNYVDSTSTLEHFLTNSKDNSYYAILTESDTTHSELEFFQHDGRYFKVYFETANFQDASALTIACSSLRKNKNVNKRQVRNYQFVLLAKKRNVNKPELHYRLVSTRKPKEQLRKKIGYIDYIIQDATEFHLPILLHPTAYEEWKSNSAIPTGIFKERTFFDHAGAIEEKRTLIGYSETVKSILFPPNCSD